MLMGMKIRQNAPSRAYMTAAYNATIPENRPVTIERDGMQVITAETVSSTTGRAECFKKIRRDYELLGKPKIEGWCIVIDRGGYIYPADRHVYAIKLYLSSL